MNKIVYSFWTAPLHKRWAKHKKNHDFEDILQSSLNCLYLSVLYAKKWGFEVEIVTDLESVNHFRDLPIDTLSTDLTFLDYNRTWTKGKMFAIAKQTRPFVHMDWDVILRKKEVVNQIRQCASDVLVQSIDTLVFEDHLAKSNEITFEDVKNIKWLVDFKPHAVEEIIRTYDSVCNTGIVGFNDMKIKDSYVSNYLKCLGVSDMATWVDSSRVIDQYSLYCSVKANSSSIQQILPDKNTVQETANKIGYTHFSYLSKYTKVVQDKIVNRINEEFPQYDYLVNPKSSVQNPIKLSLCTVVMNRFDHLVVTLENNLRVARQFNGQVDINVLDYNSTDGLEDYLFNQDWFVQGVKDGLLHYYKNFTAGYYHRTLPKNAIHNLAKGEYLINVDADNYVGPSFLTYCIAVAENEKNFFLRPTLPSAKGSLGRIMVHRDDFKTLGGYNLKISNYGYEDTEFSLRLRKLGIRKINTPPHLCQDTIDHGDHERIANEKPRTKVRFDDALEDSDYENKMIDFELYPNINQPADIELYKIDHTKKRNKVYDTSTHTLDRAI